jgi:thiamine-phosphate pyrophosphorylase
MRGISITVQGMTVANAPRRFNPRPTPRLVLVTDGARLADPLPAMARLPPHSAVILRHYGEKTRARLGRDMARLARRRHLILMVAEDWRLAADLGADGLHLPEGVARHGVLAPALGWVRRRKRLLWVACHGRVALGRAGRLGAHATLLSPVFATASHPGAPSIGAIRFGLWARRAPCPVIALGGMTGRSLKRLQPGTAVGMAAIGAFKAP